MQTTNQSIRRILTAFVNSKGAIRPHFTLTGASGSGKSFVMQNLAKEFDINILSINAASLTKEGISGSSLSRVLAPLNGYANQLTIVFVDEFDKLFMSKGESNSYSSDVQDELLKTIEDCATIAGDYGKFYTVPTDKCLFVFAGAFANKEVKTIQDLRDFGLRTEFVGRVPLVYSMETPSLKKLKAIMAKSDLLSEYLDVFNQQDGSALNILLERLEQEYPTNTIGTRLVNQLIHTYFINGFEPKKVINESAIVE